MDFLATLIGAAVGVVAGTVIQYLVQVWINRHNRKLNLRDLKVEAEYNLAIAEQILAEVGKFRAAAQPATFAQYQWYFRAKGYAIRRVDSDNKLGRVLSHFQSAGDHCHTGVAPMVQRPI